MNRGLTQNPSPTAYLRFCGPLVHLLLLISPVCTFWNELSVYKLEKEEGPSVAAAATLDQLIFTF